MLKHAVDLQRDFFDRLTAENYEEACSIFSEDGSFLFPGVPEMQGKRKIAFILKRIRARFTQISWSVTKELQVEDNETKSHYLIVQWRVSGVYKTNKPYENDGVSILLLDENQKVKSFKDYFVSTDFSD